MYTYMVLSLVWTKINKVIMRCKFCLAIKRSPSKATTEKRIDPLLLFLLPLPRCFAIMAFTFNSLLYNDKHLHSPLILQRKWCILPFKNTRNDAYILKFKNFIPRMPPLKHYYRHQARFFIIKSSYINKMIYRLCYGIHRPITRLSLDP